MSLKRICVGVIAKPFGIKGQVRVRSYTSSPDFFLIHTRLLTGNVEEICLVSPKIVGSNEIIAWIDGVNNRTDAEKLRLCKLYVERSELKQLPLGEYYYEDLVGMNVYDRSSRKLGKVEAIYDYGAGEFLEIRMENKKIATIQFNSNTIISVNEFITINKDFLLV